MKKFRLLIIRNVILYWQMIYRRLTLIMIVSIFLLMIRRIQGISLVTTFMGVQQQNGTLDIPMIWLFLIMSPTLIIGDSIQKLVKRDYLLVSFIPLLTYLSSLIVLILMMVGSIWLSWIIFAGGLPIGFSLVLLITMGILNLAMAVIQIFISPVITELLELFILVLTIAINHFPLLSQMMFLRYSNQALIVTLIELGIVAGGIGWLSKQIYRLDFLEI
jgi:hypothetical protein